MTMLCCEAPVHAGVMDLLRFHKFTIVSHRILLLPSFLPFLLLTSPFQ